MMADVAQHVPMERTRTAGEMAVIADLLALEDDAWLTGRTVHLAVE